MKSSKYYLLKEVSLELGFNERTLSGRIKKGTVSAFKDGNYWYISEREYKRLAAEQKKKQAVVRGGKFTNMGIPKTYATKAESTKAFKEQGTKLRDIRSKKKR